MKPETGGRAGGSDQRETPALSLQGCASVMSGCIFFWEVTTVQQEFWRILSECSRHSQGKRPECLHRRAGNHTCVGHGHGPSAWLIALVREQPDPSGATCRASLRQPSLTRSPFHLGVIISATSPHVAVVMMFGVICHQEPILLDGAAAPGSLVAARGVISQAHRSRGVSEFRQFP